MKTAIIVAKKIYLSAIEKYLPEDVSFFYLGTSPKIDGLVKKYADTKGIPARILKNSENDGQFASLVRNEQIVDCADRIIFFWDGEDDLTGCAINYAYKQKKTMLLHFFKNSRYAFYDFTEKFNAV